MSDYPEEPGFWSILNQEFIHAVSRDWQTYSSEVGGMLANPAKFFPVEVQNGMFIGMDPPKHDRIKALFQRGFTPKRTAEHEDTIREIACRVLDGIADRETVDLVNDVAQPIVARVIGSFMGIDEEDDVVWARLMFALVSADDPNVNPDGPATVMERDMPEIITRCQKLIAQRHRRATGRPHERARQRGGRRREAHRARDRHGFHPAHDRGQRQHQGHVQQRHAGDHREPRPAPAAARRPVADPRRRRGGAADVPRLRPLPPDRHAGHRARRLPDQEGRQGRHVVPVQRPRRGRVRGPRPLRRDAASPSTRRSAPAAGTSASAPRSPASSCA